MVRVLSCQNDGLKICHINAQSIIPKIDEFRDLFEDSKVHVICVSETWLAEGLRDELCCLRGYRVFRSDRRGRVGGGVAIYVREDIKCKLKCLSQAYSEIEYVFVELAGDESKLLVSTVYRPSSNIDISPFIALMEEISLSSPNMILCGDFNSNILRDHSLIDAMSAFNLRAVNTTIPTHFSCYLPTLLDLFWVSDLEKVALYDQLTAAAFSKHDLIYLSFDFNITPAVKTIQYRDFKHIDYALLEEHVRSINWETIYYMPSPNEQIDFLNSNILKLYNRHVPLRIKDCTPQNKPWFTQQIRTLMLRRDQAYNRWKRFRLEEHHCSYRSLRNKVVMAIRTTKSKFYCNRLNSSLSGRQLWHNLRQMGIAKGKTNCIDDIDCNDLNQKFVSLPAPPVPNTSSTEASTSNPHRLFSSTSFTFRTVDSAEVLASLLSIKSNAVGFDEMHPSFLKLILPILLPFLTYTFNAILTTGVFPGQWKLAKILPVAKNSKGDEFRPISLLPFLSKVFERIVQQQMSFYLGSSNLLTSKQSGFRKNHSCITALVSVTEDLRQAMDGDNVTFLILLDFSKAFDTVDHSILCDKLRHLFNFSSCAVKLMYSYLTDRMQAVVCNNKISDFLPTTRGVPQGSILGPLLFSLYVNELPSVAKHCSIHMYADDVQMYLSCRLGLIDHCVNHVNEDLENIARWSQQNGLLLNPQKSMSLVVSKKVVDLSYFPPVILNNAPITYVDTAKNLGMVFNRTLTWNNHINTVVGKTYGILRTMWVTQSYTPIRMRMMLAKTLVIPTLIYGCEIYSNCDSVSKRRLNVAFNSLIRYIFGLRRYDRVSNLSKSLLGMTFDNFLRFRTLTLLSNILLNHQPPYLYEEIRMASSNRSRMLIHPRYASLTSERQFFVHATRLWNSLPRPLREIDDASRFKSKIKIHFTH